VLSVCQSERESRAKVTRPHNGAQRVRTCKHFFLSSSPSSFCYIFVVLYYLICTHFLLLHLFIVFNYCTSFVHLYFYYVHSKLIIYLPIGFAAIVFAFVFAAIAIATVVVVVHFVNCCCCCRCCCA